MSVFRDLLPDARPPGRVVVLPKGAFAPTWTDRPDGDARVGLRLLSENDVREAHVKALGYARRSAEHPADGEGLYNDHLVRLAVARAATSPDDAREPYFGNMAEDTVALALTRDGMLRLYEELVLHTNEQSPLHAEATYEELFDALERLDDAPPALQSRVRRALGYVIRAIEDAGY